MKLNDELATDFGTLITIALLKFVKENETEDFDDVQTELSNIIFEIKYSPLSYHTNNQSLIFLSIVPVKGRYIFFFLFRVRFLCHQNKSSYRQTDTWVTRSEQFSIRY